MDGPDVEIDYTNHAGERRVRRIRPISLRYGTTPKQETPRYVIDAIDLERNVQRSFTVAEIHRWTELRVQSG